jgi:hypothetical protein
VAWVQSNYSSARFQVERRLEHFWARDGPDISPSDPRWLPAKDAVMPDASEIKLLIM